ncbi:type IV pilus modification protein PilV [Cognatiluteimonas profundi]|uniref:type IV pilus modification protein PilV n=1 Tax=Cognatiluteimonas profundi TaxID=2594501 RepID=UPI00131B91E5|nr:type IV pilus modification protein PilV [Lysobacter profundi]
MPIRQSRRSTPRNIAGVGLIEVLIAVVILAFGMLGIAALQAASLRNSQSAMEHSQATVQTYAILDAMRANLAVARIGGYDLATMTCNAPDTGDLAANDLHNWITSLHSTLGDSACGQIACGSLACDIKVQWDDSRGTSANATDATNAATHTVETQTRL